jgi:hypothetical protein
MFRSSLLLENQETELAGLDNLEQAQNLLSSQDSIIWKFYKFESVNSQGLSGASSFGNRML